MNKYLNNFFFLSVLLLLNSCAAQLKTVQQLDIVKNSIFKIETWVASPECSEEVCIIPTETAYELYSTGSAAWVHYKNRKVLLTAAHVCDVSSMLQKIQNGGGSVKIKAIDRERRVHDATHIKYNRHLDVCLLEIRDMNIDIPALDMSVKKPEYAERLFNLGAPLGIIDGHMVPVFEGFFFGEDQDHAFYSIPAAGGSSGSPIVDINGRLVGMIHSVHYRFHHISLSVKYSDLWNFLKN